MLLLGASPFIIGKFATFEKENLFSIIRDCKEKLLYTQLKGENLLAKNLEVTVLLDFYGEMLTEKQRSFLEYYYNDDLSLSEIAENEGITRQGVRDAIKRAEAQLFDMENKLGLLARFEEQRKGLEEITECANLIFEQNMRFGLSREINEATVRIRAIAAMLTEN